MGAEQGVPPRAHHSLVHTHGAVTRWVVVCLHGAGGSEAEAS